MLVSARPTAGGVPVRDLETHVVQDRGEARQELTRGEPLPLADPPRRLPLVT